MLEGYQWLQRQAFAIRPFTFHHWLYTYMQLSTAFEYQSECKVYVIPYTDLTCTYIVNI